MTLPLDSVFDFHGRPVAWGARGAGRPVVLVHGTPFSAQVWRRLAPLLAEDHRVHWVDLLGYGGSDMTAGRDVSLGVQNGLLAALLDHWALEAPIVLAHDFGGATALRAALLDGCRYAHLMLIDPVAIWPWGSPFVTHVRTHEAAFAGLPDYAHEALLRTYISGASSRGLPAEAVETYAAPWRGETGQTAFYRQIAQMDRRYTDEIEPRLGELDCPVTLLWGTEDSWIPIAEGERLAGMLPNCRFVPVPGSGHLVQDDAPEAILAAFYRHAAGAIG